MKKLDEKNKSIFDKRAVEWRFDRLNWLEFALEYNSRTSTHIKIKQNNRESIVSFCRVAEKELANIISIIKSIVL